MNEFLLLTLSLAFGGAVFFLLLASERPRAPQTPRFLLAFVGVGAAAVVPGLVLYALVSLFVPLQASAWGEVVFVWTVNAPLEEVTKFLCFAVLAGVLRSIRKPQDGIAQGAATGLGFALVENFLYGQAGGWPLLLVRSFVSLPGHVVYGAVWGGYYGFEAYQGGGSVRRWWVPGLALVPAAFSHATFNTLALAGAPLVLALGVNGLALAFGVFLFVRLRAASPTDRPLPLRDWRRAIPQLQHALAVDPDSATLRRRLAAYYLAGAQPERALDVLSDLGPEAWTEFYRDAALVRLGRLGDTPPSSRLNPRLFRALSGD